MLLSRSHLPRGCANQATRPCLTHPRRVAWIPKTVASQVEAATSRSPAEVVDQILKLVDNSDGGMALADDVKEKVDTLLDQLEVVGKQQDPRPLSNELLWGNYNVAYTSTRRAPRQNGQPSGGRFRSSLGRTLFRTTGLFQSVLKPDVATNKVAFRLLGVLSGYIGLRGQVLPVGDTGDTVKVLFEPPVLSLGPLHFRIGRDSDVVLATTYLDERVRIGKGSRGSLFVFTRGGPADEAGMDAVGREATSAGAAAIASAGFVAAMLGGLALWLQPSLPARILAGMIWFVCAGILAVVRGGGLLRDRDLQAIRAEQAATQPAPHS
uniref:Plastid lipid-associated protein/fibrillin conserved domain-containing protein n=1 Tax=Chlamydomonas leiostraca TaxID=1034604 RepID=A0A7S0RYJ4_9CHLO|mmetsp:Transcript_34725/g.87866  ORF Transcript_34725/g.87866 Transcript_34725/m.87866 type:complete len:323 (+) Transcript_34725:179-1147(+)